MRYAAYPLLTSIAVATAVYFDTWPSWLIAVVTVGSAQLLTELLERALPYSRTWQEPKGDFRADVLHFLLSNRAFELGTLTALVVFVPRFHLWPTHWHVLAQAALALTVLDFLWYWQHRWQHTWKPLWRLHAVHHSAERLYWWNVARSHPLENYYTALIAMIPLALCGAPDHTLAVMAAFSGVHSTLMHANIDLRTGPLDLLFNTPRVHRWHHSPRQDEQFANFSPTLTLWDWLFGTRRFDRRAIPGEDVGIGPYPRDFVGQMRAPFTDA